MSRGINSKSKELGLSKPLSFKSIYYWLTLAPSKLRDASVESFSLWRPWIILICSATLLFHFSFFLINKSQGLTEPVVARVLAVLVLIPYLITPVLENRQTIPWLKQFFIFAITITGPGLLLSGLLLELSQNDPNLALISQRQTEFVAAVGILVISATSALAALASTLIVCSIVYSLHLVFTPLSFGILGSSSIANIFSTYILFFVAFALAMRFRNDQTKNRMEAASRIGSAIAHQLRTPLATIRNLSSGTTKRLPELVEGYKYAVTQGRIEQPIPEEKLEQLKESLESISGEVEHSHALIDILIANSKPIEMLDRPSTPVSIRAVANRAVNGYPYNSPYERSLVVLEDGDDFDVYAQENMLLHVLYNLIGNAVEFSQKGKAPSVTLSVSTDTDWNVLSVRDTGIGVARSNLHRIFDPFFSRNSQNGTGIGLSFCRSVMEGLGGKIECRSEEGEYCEMLLYFPAATD